MLRIRYPHADELTIDVEGKTVRAISIGNPDLDTIGPVAESSYLESLKEYYGMKVLSTIYVNLNTNQVRFEGDKIVNI